MASLGLILLSPLFLLIGFLVKVDSPGPVLFRQERIGKHFRPFRIFKFRTMAEGVTVGGSITVGEDGQSAQAIEDLALDLASIKYRNEAAILGSAKNPEHVYVTSILPDKIRLAKIYLRQSSVLVDLSIIMRTLFGYHRNGRM